MLEGKIYKQKKNPKGKYNDKKWNKLCKKDIVNIDEIDALLYNNMSLDPVYDRMNSMYTHKSSGNSGRPKGQKNKKHHEKE